MFCQTYQAELADCDSGERIAELRHIRGGQREADCVRVSAETRAVREDQARRLAGDVHVGDDLVRAATNIDGRRLRHR